MFLYGVIKGKIKESTLALKPRADIIRSLKQDVVVSQSPKGTNTIQSLYALIPDLPSLIYLIWNLSS